MNKYLVLIIAVLVGYILLAPEKVTTKVVEIPSKSGVKIIEKPVEVVRYDTIYQNKEVKKVVRVENPINQRLLKAYEEAKKANDSILLDKLYKQSITERKYKETLRDSFVVIDVYSDVVGLLNGQKIEYTILPQKIKINTPKRKSMIFVGGYTTMGIKDYRSPSLGVDLQYIPKKQNKMFKFGYDKRGDIMVGVSFKLF